MTNAQHLSKTVPISHIYCKNKLVVLTTEWLRWLQTNWRDSGYEIFAFGMRGTKESGSKNLIAHSCMFLATVFDRLQVHPQTSETSWTFVASPI